MRETTAAQCPIHPMETQPCPVCLATMDNSMASYNTGYAAGYRAAQAACAPRELAYQCPNYGAMPPSLDHQPAATHDNKASVSVQAPALATDGPAADPIDDLCAQIKSFLADAPQGMPHEGYRYGELLSFAAAALERLRAERDIGRALVKDLCEEWNETCDCYERGVSKFEGHDGKCKGANLGEAKRALRERAERAEAERDTLAANLHQRTCERDEARACIEASAETIGKLRDIVRAADAIRAWPSFRGPVWNEYDRARAKWEDE